jgi:hypothetical protein
MPELITGDSRGREIAAQTGRRAGSGEKIVTRM